jgi:hypothetical protein
LSKVPDVIIFAVTSADVTVAIAVPLDTVIFADMLTRDMV